MGYNTDFYGQIQVRPPLNTAEVAYLRKFSDSRRVRRTKGPYFTEGTGLMGQNKDRDVIADDPGDQPSLWCQWVPTDDGSAIEWNSMEKFYGAEHWMKYLIEHFLKPDAVVQRMRRQGEFGDWYQDPLFDQFTFDHICNGTIQAEGDEAADLWAIEVRDNKVYRTDSTVVVVPGSEREV